MALQSAAGALTQPVVGLAGAPGRFVRLVWADPATAPRLTGATALVAPSASTSPPTRRAS